MKKWIALLLMMVMLCSFAACGTQTGDSQNDDVLKDQTNAQTPGGDGTTSPEGADAVTEPTPNGAVTVGYTLYAPMNYKNDDNELVGFDTELARAVFEGMGYSVIFRQIEWSARYTELESGSIDCIWNGFTANTSDDDGVARSEKVDFSYNYMENRQVIVVKSDSGISDGNALSGKLAAAESGSAGEGYAASFSGVTVKGCILQTDCLMEVKSGAADFAVIDAQLAKATVGKGDYADLMIVESLSSDVEFYAIGFEKGSELTDKVNAQLEALAADGTIAALAQKYGVANTVITDFSDQK